MRILSIIFFLLVGSIISYAQVEYTDVLVPNSIYSNAPEEIKNRKSFIREWWFYDQRAILMESFLKMLMQIRLNSVIS